MIVEEIVEDISYNENTHILTIYIGDKTPISVIINGVYYYPTQFSFDGTYITLLYVGIIPQSIIVNYLLDSYPIHLTKSIPTNTISKPYSHLFYRYNYNGSLTYNRSFKGHPTLSLTFVVPTVNELSVLTNFRNGNEFIFDTVGYFVDKVSLTREGTKLRQGNWSIINVDMTGRWTGRGNTDRNILDETVFVDTLTRNRSYYKLTELCNSLNVKYSGANIDINVPKNSKGLTSTIRDEIEKRAITIYGFPYYSNSNQIEIRKWGKTTLHFLSNADIIQPEYTIDYSGHGAIVDGVQLSNELRNAEITIENQTEDANKERIILWEFENCKSSFDARNWYGSMGVPKKQGGDILKTASGNFTNGGVNCVVRRKTILNGTEILVEEWKYGLAYLMNEIFDIYAKITFLFPSNYWGLRESTKKYTIYDKYGYITSEVKEGWTTTQYKKESAFETQEISKQIATTTNLDDLAILQKRLASFSFIRLPINEITTFTHEDFRLYYSDVQAENEGTKDEIPPYFVKNTLTVDDSFLSIPDPESTATDKKPPLATGRDFKEEKDILIYTSGSDTVIKKNPDKYTETVCTANREGEYFQDIAIHNTISEMSGRPSVANKIDISESEITDASQADDLSKYKYLLNTEGSDRIGSDIITGSVSYPDISDPDEIRKIALIDYSMQNSQNAVTTKLKVRYKNTYHEGDMLYWDNQKWVIFSISNTQTIERNIKSGVLLKNESLELTLGKYLTPAIRMTRIERDTTGG